MNINAKGKQFLCLSFLVFLVFLFSGCSTILVEQTIRDNGSSSLNILIDYSTYNKADSITDGCAEFFGDNVKCENLDDNSIRIIYDVDKLEGFESNNGLLYSEYSYDLNEVEKLLQSINSTMRGSILKRNLVNYNQLGLEFTYKIIMPNKIYNNEFGLSNGQNIEIDFNTISDDAILESRQINNYVYIFVALILLLILFLIYKKINKKNDYDISDIKREKSSDKFKEGISQVKISDSEIRCRDYIFQYKKTFPKESIEKVLVNAGFESIYVKEWIEKYY